MNRLSFTLHLASLLLALIIATSAQAQCIQKLAELPATAELFGFRLGMSKEDVRSLIPQSKFPKADEFGVVKTTINPYFDPKIDQAKFAGVRSVSLDFLDGRLISLWIGYTEDYQAHSIDEFIKQIGPSLHLTGSWSAWKGKGQQLRCTDFEIIVSTVAGGPSMRILDLAADQVVAERRQAKEDQEEAKESSSAPETTDPAGAAAAPPEIIADKHAKLFYAPGCTPLKPIEEKNKVVFGNVEEAEKNGFKAAKICVKS